MFKPAISKLYIAVFILVAILFILVNIINFIFGYYDVVVIFFTIFLTIAVLGMTLQIINLTKSSFTFEKDALVVKDAFSKKEIPYTQIRHVNTSKAKGTARFTTGALGVVIELDIGGENPRVISMSNPENFLAELKIRRGVVEVDE